MAVLKVNIEESMPKKKSAKKSKVRENSISRQGPPVNALAYNGPVSNQQIKEATDTHCFVIGLTNSIASSGGGVINTVFDSYSQLAASTNWATVQALFSEYRILAFEITLAPVNPFQTGTTYFPIISVTSHDNGDTLTSLNVAASYSSSKQHKPGTMIKRAIRMSDTHEAEWTPVSTGTSGRTYIKLYGSGLAASTTYYQYLNYVLIQCRGTL